MRAGRAWGVCDGAEARREFAEIGRQLGEMMAKWCRRMGANGTFGAHESNRTRAITANQPTHAHKPGTRYHPTPAPGSWPGRLMTPGTH